MADDDALVRSTIADTMEDAGFEVLEAGDGEEALALLEDCDGDVVALVSDIRMPRMDGLDLVRAVARRWPKVALVLVSGYRPVGE
ncbi:response regulator [Micromonospora sp. STR1s_5]|nr:response regulator [Micromonospora sp. STR1s_5]